MIPRIKAKIVILSCVGLLCASSCGEDQPQMNFYISHDDCDCGCVITQYDILIFQKDEFSSLPCIYQSVSGTPGQIPQMKDITLPRGTSMDVGIYAYCDASKMCIKCLAVKKVTLEEQQDVNFNLELSDSCFPTLEFNPKMLSCF